MVTVQLFHGLLDKKQNVSKIFQHYDQSNNEITNSSLYRSQGIKLITKKSDCLTGTTRWSKMKKILTKTEIVG